MIYSIIILYALAGFFNSIMDNLDFRVKEIKIFGISFKDNPWAKWKNGRKSEGEAFPFSSTILVFLTDGWHCSKWLMYICIEVIISMLVLDKFGYSYWFIPVGVLMLKSIRGGVFSIFFLR